MTLLKYIQVISASILIALSLMGCNSITTQATPSSVVQFLDVHFEANQWMKPPLEADVYLDASGIYALDKGVAFLYGGLTVPVDMRHSVLLRTEDGGKHWVEVMNPEDGSDVLQVVFGNGGGGWALVMWTVEGPGAPLLYHTQDYGRTWTKLSDVPKWVWYGWPIRMKFFDSMHGQITIVYDAGLSETNRIAFLSTSDGGLTWRETSSIPITDENAEATLAPYKPNLRVALGQDGSLWRLEPGDWEKPVIVRRNLVRASPGPVVSIIHTRLRYVEGHITLP